MDKIDSVFFEELILPDIKVRIEKVTQIDTDKYFLIPNDSFTAMHWL